MVVQSHLQGTPQPRDISRARQLRNGNAGSTIVSELDYTAIHPENIEGHENRVHDVPRSIVVSRTYVAIVGRESFDVATVGVQGALRQVSRPRWQD